MLKFENDRRLLEVFAKIHTTTIIIERKAGMAVVAPLPYSLLVNAPNLALLQNFDGLSSLMSNLEECEPHVRYQAMDITVATLSAYNPHENLAQNLGQQLSSWDHRGPALSIPNLEELVRSALHSQFRERRVDEDNDAVEDESEADYEAARAAFIHNSEAVVHLGNWSHSIQGSRILALNLAERVLQDDERFQESLPSIRRRRR